MLYPPPRSDRWDPWVVAAMLTALVIAGALIHGL
jgi:hypothetical protein